MIHFFRRHIASCPHFGQRTGSKCPRKPACPIHYEGVDGSGQRHTPKALIDPRTGSGTRDWAVACEIVRDLETRAPNIPVVERTSLSEAIGHFLKVKEPKERVCYRRNRRLLALLQEFMEARPRGYQFVHEIQFVDLVNFCVSWTGGNRTKINQLGRLNGFLRYCQHSNFTAKNLGEGLRRTVQWPATTVPREPFLEGEIERVWAALPEFALQFNRVDCHIAEQMEAFVLVVRYTGLDVSTTIVLPKSHLRENRILTYRQKNGAEVWSVIPGWAADKLRSVSSEAEKYFFWNGHDNLGTTRKNWFRRFRILLNLAGLPHRTAHNFRHHFAVEHLLNGTPIEDVSRLLGHRNIDVTLKSYAAWIKRRQEQLEEHQRKVWESDPLHQRMVMRRWQEDKRADEEKKHLAPGI